MAMKVVSTCLFLYLRLVTDVYCYDDVTEGNMTSSNISRITARFSDVRNVSLLQIRSNFKVDSTLSTHRISNKHIGTQYGEIQNYIYSLWRQKNLFIFYEYNINITVLCMHICILRQVYFSYHFKIM